MNTAEHPSSSEVPIIGAVYRIAVYLMTEDDDKLMCSYSVKQNIDHEIITVITSEMRVDGQHGFYGNILSAYGFNRTKLGSQSVKYFADSRKFRVLCKSSVDDWMYQAFNRKYEGAEIILYEQKKYPITMARFLAICHFFDLELFLSYELEVYIEYCKGSFSEIRFEIPRYLAPALTESAWELNGIDSDLAINKSSEFFITDALRMLLEELQAPKVVKTICLDDINDSTADDDVKSDTVSVVTVVENGNITSRDFDSASVITVIDMTNSTPKADYKLSEEPKPAKKHGIYCRFKKAVARLFRIKKKGKKV